MALPEPWEDQAQQALRDREDPLVCPEGREAGAQMDHEATEDHPAHPEDQERSDHRAKVDLQDQEAPPDLQVRLQQAQMRNLLIAMGCIYHEVSTFSFWDS